MLVRRLKDSVLSTRIANYWELVGIVASFLAVISGILAIEPAAYPASISAEDADEDRIKRYSYTVFATLMINLATGKRVL